MFGYVAKRVITIIPMLLILSFFVFFIFIILYPGDIARMYAGERATEEQVEKIRHDYGLDKPFYVQYGIWLSRIVRGDFGKSFKWEAPIFTLIKDRIPVTLGITLTGLAISLIIGLPLGMVGALRRGKKADYMATSGSLFGLSMPNFWLALMLILIFCWHLGWVPVPGAATGLHPLIFLMAGFVLGTSHAGSIARLTRSSMLEVMGEDYIRTARAKGLKERTVIWKHALRNALLPIVTLMALRLPWLFAGTVVLESIFVLPGMGRLVFISIVESLDLLVVQMSLLIFVVVVVLANLMADILYAYLNPRIRYR